MMTSCPGRSLHRSSSALTCPAWWVMARVRSDGLAARSFACSEASSARRWSVRAFSMSHFAVFSASHSAPILGSRSGPNETADSP
jgi:hypothetical protein